MSTKKKFINFILAAFTTLVIMIILVPIVLLVMYSIKYYSENSNDKKTLIANREVSKGNLDNSSSEIIHTLKNIYVVDSKIYSSKIDVCSSYERYGGFLTTGWYQECILRYVSGFNTDASRSEIIQRLSMDDSNREYLSRDYYDVKPCDMYYDPTYKTKIIYLPANYEPVDFNSCKRPNLTEGYLPPPPNRDNISTQIYKTFDLKKIDYSKNQVWVEMYDSYYSKDLGCMGISVFCILPSKPFLHPHI